jgi:hypothetical protein
MTSPLKMAASATRSRVESRNAPHGPLVPFIRASSPSSMSVNTKKVHIAAPGNSHPIGNSASALADTPTVPMTVSAFGVTGVRARASPTGVRMRAIAGRSVLSMAAEDLTGLAGARWFRCASPARLAPMCYLVATPSILYRGVVVTARWG